MQKLLKKIKNKNIKSYFLSLEPKQFRKLLLVSFGLILVIPLSIFYLFNNKTKADWWNEDWRYRKSVIIDKTSAAQTDIYISFDDSDVLDTSDTSRFQTDCGDLRFTKDNGELLPYYINSGCGTSSTDIDVYFDSLPLGTSNIYMYYGNSSVIDGFESAAFSTEATNYTIGTPATEEKGPGPVAYWAFDEGTGTTANDTTANNNNATWGITNITDIEQQINITNQQFSEGSITPIPSNNSLGLINYNGSKYNDETVYFEAVIKSNERTQTSNQVGYHSSIDCSNGTDDCKMVYYDTTDGDLRFLDCDDASCSTGTSTIIDGNIDCSLTNCSTTDDVGEYQSSIDCSNGPNDCKISYYNTTKTALYMADCDNATCSSGTTTLLDGYTGSVLTGDNEADSNGTYTSIDCSNGSDDCKISYRNTTQTALYMADCDNATCSSGTAAIADGNGIVLSEVGHYSAIDCSNGDDDCKIAYTDYTENSLRFFDCDNETCTKGTMSILNGATNGNSLTGASTTINIDDNIAIDCSNGSNDCKIAYLDTGADDLYFADCDSTTCNSGSTTLLDGGTTGNSLTGASTMDVMQNISIDCSNGSDNCKISYYDQLGGDLYFADCDSTTCNSGTATNIDGSSSSSLTGATDHSTGQSNSIDCSNGSDDCKISYRSSSGGNLYFADCDNATCSSGTSTLLDGEVTGSLSGGGTYSCGHSSIDCSNGSDNCKISYESGSSDLRFADCDNATCSSGTSTLLDGGVSGNSLTGAINATLGMYSSLDCSNGSTDCKISYFDTTTDDLRFADCDNDTCSSGTSTLLDGGASGNSLTGAVDSSTGYYKTSIDCSNGSDDCKISYYDSYNYNLRIADCDSSTCNSGNATIADDGGGVVWISLYDNSGNIVNDGILMTKSDTIITHKTNVPINLTNDTEYTIRTSTTDAVNAIPSVLASRLIIVQSGDNITDTQTQIEVGSANTTSATSYQILTDPKIYKYDADVYDPAPTAYFEATLVGSDASAVSYAALSSSSTCASTISGSEVSVTGTTWDRQRSSSITLTDDTDYYVCVHTSSGDTGQMANAKIIFDQSDIAGIRKVETIQSLINTPKTDTDDVYSLQNYLNYFDSSNFTYTDKYYQSTMKTTSGTGYSQLYNITATSAVSSSELTTTSTSYERKRTTSTVTIPSGGKTLDTQVKNSASSGNTTSVSSSELIIQTSGGSGTGGNPTWQSEDMCVFEKCLYFDGIDDYIDVSGETYIQNGEAFTIATWVFPLAESTDNSRVVINLATESGDDISLFLSDSTTNAIGLYQEGSSNNRFHTDNTNYNDLISKWSYIVVTNDGTHSPGMDGSKIYLNGIELSATTASGTWAAGSQYVGWSGYVGGDLFAGRIDEMKIYPYARSASQIKTDYNSRGTNQGSSATLGHQDQTYLSNGLVGYWKMDEPNGTVISDASGNGFNGSATQTTISSGKFGNGRDFDNDTDNIVVTDSTDSPLDITNQITLSAWIRSEGTQDQYDKIVAKYKGASNYPYQLDFEGASDDKIYFRLFDGTNTYSIASDADIPQNEWLHVVGSYDGDTMRLFINGQEQSDSISTSFTLNTNDENLLIGGRIDSNTQIFDGKIDEVRIYNRALSPAEVSKLYNWAPWPVAYYPLDENTGTSDVYDNTGNSYNGTLTSITESSWVRGKFGSALNLDGSADFIDIGTGPTKVNTVSFWVKPATITEYFVNVTANTDYIWANAGTITATGFTLPTIYVNGIESTALTAGEWQFVTITTDTAENASNFEIGRTTDTDYLEGSIDDIKLYNYIRSPGQIIEDMNAGHPIGGSPIGSQVAYWGFDEMYGDAVNDTIGNYNGNLAGISANCPTGGTDACPTWTNDGRINKALYFSTDDYVDFGDISEIEGAAVTFSSWVKTDNITADHDFFTKGTHSTNQPLLIWRDETVGSGSDMGNTDTLSVIVYDGTTQDWYAAPSGFLNDTDWHHIAVSIDPSNEMKIYIDGKLVRTGTLNSTGIQNTANALRIGTDINGSGQELDGYMDEVKIYTSVLTQEQILIDMNANSAIDFGSTTKEADNLEDGAGNPPVGYWDFNENTGSISNSKSSLANEGTHNNSPTWIRGPKGHGSAIQFNGTNQRIGGDGDVLEFELYQHNVTKTAWIYMTQAPSGSYSTYNPSYIQDDNGNLEFFVNSDQTFGFLMNPSGGCSTSGVTIPLNEWHHITGILDDTNNTIYLYTDGILSKTCTGVTNQADYNLSHAWGIGSNKDGGDYFAGKIDEVKIYNYARTPAQIAYDYNRGAPIAHWQFDECQGATANDASGNGNNGTINAGDSTGNNDSVGTCSSGASDPTNEMWNAGTTGKFNASLDFDDVDDNISVTDNDKLDLADNISISVWVKTGANEADNVIVSKGTQYEVGINADGDIYWYDGNTTNDDASAKVLTGSWHHVVVTNNDTTATYYVDGILTGTDTVGIGANNATSLLIGSDGTNFFDGQIDDVRIYNYTLSPAQIKKVMNENSGIRFGP